MTKPTCSTCPHWGTEPQFVRGCHRFPPTSYPTGIDGLSMYHNFPRTCATHGCGEHPQMAAWLASRQDDVVDLFAGTVGEPTVLTRAETLMAEGDLDDAKACRIIKDGQDRRRGIKPETDQPDELRARLDSANESNDALRREAKVLRSANEEVNGRVAKQIAKVNERDTMIWQLRAEVHQLVDAADDLAGQLSEAKATIADRNKTIGLWVDEVNRIGAAHEVERSKATNCESAMDNLAGVLTKTEDELNRANQAYRELADAAQSVSDGWGATTVHGWEWLNRLDRLKATLNRHARPADFNTDNQAAPKKPGSLSVTLDTAGLEARTKEMAEKLVAERVIGLQAALGEANAEVSRLLEVNHKVTLDLSSLARDAFQLVGNNFSLDASNIRGVFAEDLKSLHATAKRVWPDNADRPTRKDAALAFAKEYADDPRVMAVIGTHDSIVVYVDDTKLPAFPPITEWQGWTVEVVNHGPMATMGGPT